MKAFINFIIRTIFYMVTLPFILIAAILIILEICKISYPSWINYIADRVFHSLVIIEKKIQI